MEVESVGVTYSRLVVDVYFADHDIQSNRKFNIRRIVSFVLRLKRNGFRQIYNAHEINHAL